MAILINCSNDSTENNFSEDQTTPSLSVSTQTLTFSDTEILMFSEPKTLTFSGLDLSDVLVINTGFNFEISLDAQNFECFYESWHQFGKRNLSKVEVQRALHARIC